jgi:hypothetical protein
MRVHADDTSSRINISDCLSSTFIIDDYISERIEISPLYNDQRNGFRCVLYFYFLCKKKWGFLKVIRNFRLP